MLGLHPGLGLISTQLVSQARSTLPPTHALPLRGDSIDKGWSSAKSRINVTLAKRVENATSEATAPSRQAVCVASTTSLTASSVERSVRLPICVRGKKFCVSAAAATWRPTAVSITFPIVHKRAISR